MAEEPLGIDQVDTSLDLSQPDGLPKQARNTDGTFASEKKSLPAYLVNLAKDAGYTDDEIAEFPSESSLGVAVRRTRQQTEAARQYPREIPTQKPEAPEPEFDFGGVKLEDFDENLAKAMKASHQANAAELKALRAELAQTKARDTERTNRQTAQICDDAFEALGPDYEEVFGKGSGYELKNSNPQAYENRLDILNTLRIDPSVASGKSILSAIKEKVSRLIKIAPKSQEAPAPKNGHKTKEEWDRGGTARPTQRNGANEAKGPELARKNLEAHFREEGLNTVREDRDILDSLPKR